MDWDQRLLQYGSTVHAPNLPSNRKCTRNKELHIIWRNIKFHSQSILCFAVELALSICIVHRIGSSGPKAGTKRSLSYTLMSLTVDSHASRNVPIDTQDFNDLARLL